MAVKFILAASLLYLGVLQVHAFSSGAPPDVCEDLTPQHNTEAQKNGFPYSIKASQSDIKTSGKVKVTITGKKRGETFKGFIIQARVGDIPYGTFEENDLAKTIDCHGGKKNSATHKSSDPKESVTLTWTAPPKLQGRVVFTATVARDGGTYWVAQKGAEVSVAP